MPNVDLNSAIASVVSDEVARALAPYQNVLDRLSRMVGIAPAPVSKPALRKRGRPPKAVPTPGRRAMRAAANHDGAGEFSKFAEGQMVKYKQGKGTFDARVIGLNPSQGTVLLQRTSDGKKVERLASRIEP